VARNGELIARPQHQPDSPMPDFALLLDAPDRNWALHVESLIQKALGERGSVTLGLPGERLPSAPGAPRYVVTGLAVCDEPEEEMLAAIRAALVDYDVEERPAPMAATKIVVRPREG